MIKLLSINNLAVVRQAQIEFNLGLNVLSGETGAGKSVVLSAIGLLLGERASQELIRTGETRAVVEGIFDIEGNTPLVDLLESRGIELADYDLVIKREISQNGRGKVFINHQPTTLSLLKEIQPHLIDVHGQGEQQSLLMPSVQMHLLDLFAGAMEMRLEVENTYETLVHIAQELESLRQSEAERLQLLDLLTYQVEEIEKSRPEIGEDLQLESERNVLVNAEKLATLCEAVNQLLYDNDDSIISQLSQAQRRLGELAVIDEDLHHFLEQLDSAKYSLEDVTYGVRNYAEKIVFSPSRLQLVEDRLVELDKLKRKYGGSLEAVIAHLEGVRQRRAELVNSDERRELLIRKFKSALEQYRKQAALLSKTRKAKARELEKVISGELSQVSLEHSRFRVNFNYPTVSSLIEEIGALKDLLGDVKVGRNGAETIEFFFSANEGEELRPLREVASGGELSRLMLVIKSITAPTRYPRTLVFDEVDSGIGGRVSEAVGIRLKRLSLINQVICITHQAQIARHADHHYRVLKQINESRTMTTVDLLNRQQRIEELARMIGGSEITTITKQHAKEMLKEA